MNCKQGKGRVMRFVMLWLLAAVFGLAVPRVSLPAAGQDGAAKPSTVELYFFWSAYCPHCNEARPYIEGLGRELPWLWVHSLELTSDRQHADLYRQMASALGREAKQVPAFLFCGHMYVGYDNAQGMGRFLRERLQDCRDRMTADQPAPAGDRAPVQVPLLGQLDPTRSSLLVFTLVLAGLDSFNPCAFFVLLFLLSLLVHAGSRPRMLLVGGVFILTSGLVYFLSMAAWLNLFALIGHMQAVTVVAGLLAVVVAAFNIKDFFRFRQGPSLGIRDASKPGLYQRMRRLISAESLAALLPAATGLAVVANLYELLCTAGFPMVYTRALTLHELPATQYYLYLLLYNVVYIVPLFLILLVFVLTLGQRKLQEHEGRALKLLSGLMMLGLGLVLLLQPALLNRLWTAAGLLLAAILVTWLLTRLRR